MIEVVSFVGVSYTGKSTLAEGVVDRLAQEGVEADIIKKDEAMKALGRERYGEDDPTGGYSITGFLKHGQIPSTELHAWMNQEVQTSLAMGRVALLEGGTRTRTAQSETLANVDLDDDGLKIFMMDLPFGEVIRRARERRKQAGRYDDMLPVALAKLYGQYKGARSANAPQPGDTDVTVLDARQPSQELIELVANEIFESRATSPVTETTKRKLLETIEAKAGQGKRTTLEDGSVSPFDSADVGFPSEPDRGMCYIDCKLDTKSDPNRMGHVASVYKLTPSGDGNTRTTYTITRSADGLQVERYVTSLGELPKTALPNVTMPDDVEITSSQELGVGLEGMLLDVVGSLLPELVAVEQAKVAERSLGLSIVPEREAKELITFIKTAGILPSTFE